MTRSLVVAITGASGSVYAQRLLQYAVDAIEQVSLVLSDRAPEVIAHELGITLTLDATVPQQLIGDAGRRVRFFGHRDMNAPFASGSAACDALVIVPCTMGTAARIATGVSTDLITRAADVALKERKKLLLVPRETPWSAIHLRNLLTLAEAGAVVMPAAPPFYHRPRTLDDLVDSIADRILRQLGVEREGAYRWQGSAAHDRAQEPDA